MSILKHFCLISAFFLIPSIHAGVLPTTYVDLNRLNGRVTASIDARPLTDAEIRLEGTDLSTRTDAQGHFLFENLPKGSYTLQITKTGYASKTVEARTTVVTLNVTLDAEPDEGERIIETMVVTPSHYALKTSEATQLEYLDKEQIRFMPKFGDDLYRTIAALPGTFSDKVSARFSVRGGLENETLVLIDGMEIYEPFHLKDFGGIFSILDPEAVGSLSLTTGGFTSEWGDRMSGVLDMRTLEPTERRTRAAVSFSNASAMTQGTFSGGRGKYLVSARRGYLDILLAMVGEDDDLKIPYLDSLGKLSYSLNERHEISLQYLLSDDKVDFSERDEYDDEKVVTSYGSTYLWSGLSSNWSDTVHSQTTLYQGKTKRDRFASDQPTYENNDGVLDDTRHMTYTGLKMDWTLTLSPSNFLKLGFDYREAEADYDYSSTFVRDDSLFGHSGRTINHQIEPEGESTSLYVSDRFFLGEKITVELGLRYDDRSWIDTDMLSPRFNLAWNAGEDTVLRTAVGRYYQPQSLNELQIEDDVTVFHPAPYADHYSVGLEHRFDNGLEIRSEVYLKRYNDLYTRFQNLYDHSEAFPEWEDDRIAINAEQAEARGVDLVLRKSVGSKLNWMFNYTWQEVEDEVDGEKIPRQWGQPHNVKANLNWRLNRKWNMHFAFTYSSGWRTTHTEFTGTVGPEGNSITPVLGPINGEALGDFHSLDYRLTRNFLKDGNKGISFFVDLANVYARESPIGVNYDLYYRDGVPFIDRDEDTSLPLLPSLGFAWVF